MRRQRFFKTYSPCTSGLFYCYATSWWVSFYVVFGLFLTWPINLQAQDPHPPNIQVERFSVEQGLVDRNVTSILQDKQGYIWIATAKGLSRFDGYNFLTYNTRPRNPHKISYSFLFRILLAPLGSILIQYNNSGTHLDLLNPLTGQLTAVEIDQNAFTRMLIPPFQAPDGNIYIITSDEDRLKVYRLDEPAHRFVFMLQLVKTSTIQPLRVNFLQASDGSFWFALNEPDHNFYIIHSDAAGNILHKTVVPDIEPKVVSEAMDVFLTEKATGQIWLATTNRGVLILETGSQKEITCRPHPSLKTGNVSFVKDKVGNLLVYYQNAGHGLCYVYTANGLQLDYTWLFDYQDIINQPFSEDFTLGLFAIV